MSSNSVGVELQGREYQIRSDADAESLQRVAGYVDKAMNQIREVTNTVDTLDVALLTALNLAREVIASRESSSEGGEGTPEGEAPRLRALIELVESVEARAENRSLEGPGVPRSSVSETPLLTLPTGDELEAIRGDLLAPLGSSPSVGNVDAGEGGQG